jgi:hypothetical protein
VLERIRRQLVHSQANVLGGVGCSKIAGPVAATRTPSTSPNGCN